MPLYDVVCVKCGKEEEVFRTIKEYDNLPSCCGSKMQRELSAPAVIADIKPYKSTQTGEMIESRKKHRDHLKRHNLVELGNEMPKIKPIPKIGNTKQDLVETCRKLKVKGFH